MEEFMDAYFNRSLIILGDTSFNPLVRYQVFARKNLQSLFGIKETVNYIYQSTSHDSSVKIKSLREKDEYIANTPLMIIEGKLQTLINLETKYLSILSSAFTGKVDLSVVEKNVKDISIAAKGKPLYYFGARHFDEALDIPIANICKENGFSGCSTRHAMHEVWGRSKRAIGTIPHSLILAIHFMNIEDESLNNSATLGSIIRFDRSINSEIPRVALIDTFNTEIDEALLLSKMLFEAHYPFKGFRIDTCGENYAQGENEDLPDLFECYKTTKNLINPKMNYVEGKGVTIKGVWALRKALDKQGGNSLDLTIAVSSGFDANKTAAFIEADEFYQKLYGKPLFDSIGTGSVYPAVITTSDIIGYYSRNKFGTWINSSKVGRGCFPGVQLLKKVIFNKRQGTTSW